MPKRPMGPQRTSFNDDWFMSSSSRWVMAESKTKKTKSDSDEARTMAENTVDAETIIAQARARAFANVAPADAFTHFRPQAEAVPLEGLSFVNGQPLLMRTNVLAALAAMDDHWARAVRALREPRLEELFELPALVMALQFASSRVPVAKLSSGEIDAMLNEGGPWRTLMLDYLEVASHPLLNLLPRERVAAVRAGSGKLDKAQDFVSIAGIFAEFSEPLRGKHPFPVEPVERLADLGTVLVQQMRPGGAAIPTAERGPEAILRDQFAALVADRYDYLGVVAAVALGKRRADQLLPALRARVIAGTRDASTPEPPAGSPDGNGPPSTSA